MTAYSSIEVVPMTLCAMVVDELQLFSTVVVNPTELLSGLSVSAKLPK